MRNSGTCLEVFRLSASDHVGWAFDAADEFARVALDFLTEGAERGELLMYVAEDPDPAAVDGLVGTVGAEAVQVASIRDVYGASGVVDAARQRATFAGVLADALSGGYTGIRVAADNTPLVLDPERLAAWEQWELVADHFMSENPVTGLCAFDRNRVEVARLRHLATLHPMSSASCPVPQYQMFVDDGQLRVVGLVDLFAVGEMGRALNVLPAKTPVVIDLGTAKMMSTGKVLAALDLLAQEGNEVTLEGPLTAVRDARKAAGSSSPHLRFAGW